jgi:alanyl-tRNA synthetase
LEDNKNLKKQNSNLLKEINYLKILKNIEKKNIINQYNVQIVNLDYIDGKILKNILEDVKSSQEKLILTVIQRNNKKAEIYVLVTVDCFNHITAKEIINNLNKDIGSSGGGKDDLAQAGIEFTDDISLLNKKISNHISKIINNKGK